ncbi:MAG: phytanoyl-CoA dioxygenase family protein, partial [Ktedonobacteraceae bacterium]|nr:phytanoyl-CoA dioxygenase family protein [Ktedonobacteraceae bacterium]
MTTTSHATSQPRTYEPYRVSVREYVTFHEQGFLVVRGLIPPEDVQEMHRHMDDILAGRDAFPGIQPPPEDWDPDKKVKYYLRVHMLHRVSPIHERFLLHPRTLDVLEALIGPDVLALQSMLFFKQPGQPGQGYHQDSYYIPTIPDTLCGAWVALDRADEENGCLWMTVGSQHEPIYPDSDGVTSNGRRDLSDIEPIHHASHTDENINGLTRIARKYPGREVKAEVDPGDVVFFAGHILHRSHRNLSQTRTRRAFVGHYCNARSWVPWNHGPFEGDSGNNLHILARGSTHLPYAQPRFGTPCAANQPPQPKPASGSGPVMSMMGDMSMPELDEALIALTPHPEGPH